MICNCCGEAFRRPGSPWCNECGRELNGSTEPAPTSWIAWLGVAIIAACAVWAVVGPADPNPATDTPVMSH